jgi:hypothetical protein
MFDALLVHALNVTPIGVSSEGQNVNATAAYAKFGVSGVSMIPAFTTSATMSLMASVAGGVGKFDVGAAVLIVAIWMIPVLLF